MPKFTATIITKDEEANIEDALRSVDFADEIVVVDSGSTDRTCEIAAKYTDKVIVNDWPGHVKQKQFAVDSAANDWILSLDADERISKELAGEIKNIMSGYPDADGYEVNRRSKYLGKWIRYSGWYPDKRIRLFNRTKAEWGGYDPHDRVVCRGKTGRIEKDILHIPYKDVSHHLKTIDSYTSIMAQRFFEKGKRANLLDVTLRPVFTFLKKMIVKTAFLDGYQGFVIAATSAYSVMFKYIKLLQLQKGKQGG